MNILFEIFLFFNINNQRMTIYICKHCNKDFTSKSGLWYHSKKCNNNEIKKEHRCSHCNYKTSGPKCQLINHIYSKHTPEKERPHQCMHCDRGFAQKSHLQKHMKKIHNLDLPENIDRTIIEYHITVLDKSPISTKTKSRINLYNKYPIIKTKNMNSLKFYYTKTLQPFHLHYDQKKGYIHFVSKTIDDLRI